MDPACFLLFWLLVIHFLTIITGDKTEQMMTISQMKHKCWREDAFSFYIQTFWSFCKLSISLLIIFRLENLKGEKYIKA